MPLRSILFDLDGVLANTVELHYRAWKKILSEYSIPFTRQDNEKLRGLTRPQSLEVILGNTVLLEVQKQSILVQKNKYFKKELAQIGPEYVMPGVQVILQEARAAKLRLGVASSSRNTRPVLDRLGLLCYFDKVADGNHIQNSKPAPDVYLYAASLLGVKPSECLVIEDSTVGVEAGLQAGMCVVGLGPPSRVGNSQASFNDLSEVSLINLVLLHKQWQSKGIDDPGNNGTPGS